MPIAQKRLKTPADSPADGAEAEAEAETTARILLVDDDERNLLAMAEVLAPLAEIVQVTSGRDALRELLKQDFAVILLDVFMPDMDGYETAGLIRSREQTARIPIIFLSAVNKETEHLMRGYAMGAVDYVFKPVDPIVLRSKAAVFVDLYQKSQEIERKAAHEQALLDANLRANAERLRIEQELRRAEQRQAAIIQSLPMVLYLEPAGLTRQIPNFVSGDIEAISGFSYEQLKADPQVWVERLHPDDRERVITALRGREASGRFSIEYRWQCADGSYKYLLDQSVMVPDGEGRPLEFAGTLIDVTEQRHLEEQLVQARKMDALGQLTGGVAHDFNNLLASVLGGLDLLERRLELGEREKQIAMHMRHAADRGVELVRRLMTFARKQSLSPEAVDPAELGETLAGLLDHTFGSEIEVAWTLEAQGLQIYADRSQLELALMNLLINARDAMPEGGRIEVSVTPETDGEGAQALCISVRDQGSGIPPEIVEKVTEPFFTTKPAGKGTGLGLSMVAGFVQQSEGEMRIRSAPDEGTAIELVLPAVAASAPRAAVENGHAAPVCASVRRLLLVDDEEGIRVVVGEQLQELGIEVTTAVDAAEALAHLESGSEFDFVLTDLSMPGLDGAQLLDRVRQSWPQLPAAIMTGNPKKLEKYDGQLAAVHVVQKPLSLADLEAVLSRPH
jgi:PAS domain S-box-containing protein